jgi:hypothetical protein
MQVSEVHRCGCILCQQAADHPAKEHHRQINLLMSQLPGAQRRLYAAIEAKRLGRSGCRLMAEITGLCEPTIRRGGAELATLLEGKPLPAKGRRGRRSTEAKYPNIKGILEQLLVDETAGDPMTRKKWVRISCRKISKKLAAMGYEVNYRTVCRLLKDMDYSLKVNVKKRASTAYAPKRDAQFKYIAAQKAAFLAAGDPVISIDAKKKELIGNFKVNGKSWCKDAIEVNDYAFASMAECVATSYGVYDVATNKGYVWVGTSGDTPLFAGTVIKQWWLYAWPRAVGLAQASGELADPGGAAPGEVAKQVAA